MKSLNRHIHRISVIAAAIIMHLAVSSYGTTIYFNVADGNWTNANSWNPAQIPIAGDDARVNNGGTLHIDSDVECYNLSLGYDSGDTGRLEMTAGSLTVSFAFAIGRSGTGYANQSGGDVICNYYRIGEYGSTSYGDYTLSGGTIQASNSMYIGDHGTGILYQTAGVISCAPASMRIGASTGGNGRYEISDGTADLYLFLGGWGSGYFKQTGGTVTATRFTGGENVSATGTYELVDGTLFASNYIYVGSKGTFTFLFGNADTAGTLVETNGTMRMQIGSSTADSGILRGWGTIGLTQRLLFYYNGTIIADGYGIDRDLDFSQMDMTWQTYTNSAGEAGAIYAQNHGRLVFKAINVNTYTYYYGEDADNKRTNVINCAVAKMNMYSGGSPLHVALLAPDRTDVAPDIRSIGIWEFALDDTNQLSKAVLSFRYDDSAVSSLGIPESELLLLRQNEIGTDWEDVTGSIDTNRHVIISQELTYINSQFVVGLPPLPKGTMILVQ